MIIRNFIFRNILFLSIIFSSIFFPLYFAMPQTTGGTAKILLAVAVALLAAAEIALYVFIEYKMTITPIKTINAASKMLSNGEYDADTAILAADNEIKALAKTTAEIADEFKSLEQMRKSFIANASHELRSPLTSIQGFAQAMLDGTIAVEERDKYLEIVLGETKRLNSLITSMLDLSRLESNQCPITPTKFEINAAIRQVIERFEPNLLKKEIRLDVDFGNDETCVFADKEKIVQVLVNLIDNAIKYSPSNSNVIVSTYIKGLKVYITVKDHGYGINKKDQILIWDRFYMADKARTPNKSKGTGLGLSIVKRIIEEHDEAIWVESSRGTGSTFIFTLPLYDSQKHKKTENRTA